MLRKLWHAVLFSWLGGGYLLPVLEKQAHCRLWCTDPNGRFCPEGVALSGDLWLVGTVLLLVLTWPVFRQAAKAQSEKQKRGSA